MTSDEFFKQNINKFDFIYVDGDHAKDQVYKDLKRDKITLNGRLKMICLYLVLSSYIILG